MEWILKNKSVREQTVKVSAKTMEDASQKGPQAIKNDKWDYENLTLLSCEPQCVRVPYPDEFTEMNFIDALRGRFSDGQAVTFFDTKGELSDVTVEKPQCGWISVCVYKNNTPDCIFCESGWSDGYPINKWVQEALIMAACYDGLHSNKPYPKNVEPEGFRLFLKHDIEEFGAFPNARCDLDIRQVVEIAHIGAYAVKQLLAIIDNGTFKHFSSIEDAGKKFEGRNEIDRFERMTDEMYGKWMLAECSDGYTPGGWVNMLLLSDGSVVSGNMLKGVMWRPDLLELQGVLSY